MLITYGSYRMARPHTARATMNMLGTVFPEHVASQNGNVQWPTRSPDLTACDIFCGVFLRVQSTSQCLKTTMN